jgi:hypothetical protein
MELDQVVVSSVVVLHYRQYAIVGLGQRDGVLQLCEDAIESCTCATGDGKHQPR